MDIRAYLTHITTFLAALPAEIHAEIGKLGPAEAAAVTAIKAVAEGVEQLAPLLGPAGAEIAAGAVTAETVVGKLIPVVEKAAEGVAAALEGAAATVESAAATAMAEGKPAVVAGAAT